MTGFNPISAVDPAAHAIIDTRPVADAIANKLPPIAARSGKPRTERPVSLGGVARIGKQAHAAGVVREAGPALVDLARQGQYLKSTATSLVHGRSKEAGLNYRMAFHHGARTVDRLADAMMKVPVDEPLAVAVKGIALAAKAADRLMPSAEKTRTTLAVRQGMPETQRPTPACAAGIAPDAASLATGSNTL